MDRYLLVRQTILDHHEWRAAKIARFLGLTDELGDDAASEYVRSVRKKMRDDGDLIMPPEVPQYAGPEERLADVMRLFEIRNYTMKKKAAYNMLLATCYWIMLLAGNLKAVNDTMEMNNRLKRPLTFLEIERVCNEAQEKGFDALDDEKNEEAKEHGFPGAGLNWTSDSLYHKFMVQDHELQDLKTIGKPVDKTKPWGVPNPARME
jgi:hypothetical protein